MTKIDGKWFSEPLSCVLGLSSLHSSINQIKSKLVIDTSTADQQCWARPAQDRTQIRPHILVPSLPAFLRPTHTREIVPAASPLIEFRDWIVNLENWKPSFWLFSPGHRPGGIRCSGSSTLVLTSWHQSGFESPSPPNIRTSGHQPPGLNCPGHGCAAAAAAGPRCWYENLKVLSLESSEAGGGRWAAPAPHQDVAAVHTGHFIVMWCSC